jgi:hypothetical protein
LKPLGQAADRIEEAGKAVARRSEAYPYPLRLAFGQSGAVSGANRYTDLRTPVANRASLRA